MGELIDIVRDCENYLGWLPVGESPWKGRAAAAARLEKALAMWQPPATTEDLRLALAWCVRHRQEIGHPTSLLFHVEDARKHASVPEASTDITDRIQAAIAWENDREQDDSDEWIGRLVRSSGASREITLAEWAASRHG